MEMEHGLDFLGKFQGYVRSTYLLLSKPNQVINSFKKKSILKSEVLV